MRLLLCEGPGDEAFLRRLITQRGLPDFHFASPPEVSVEGTPHLHWGKAGFFDRINALRIDSRIPFDELSGVLVVGDNDDDPAESYEMICAQIRRVDWCEAPLRPLQPGRKDQNPPILVMMLPWIDLPGRLENLCLTAMRQRWPIQSACLDEYCGCTGTDTWSTSRNAKMRVRSLIAATCESDPNTSLQYAWSRREDLIPLDHEVFNGVVDFLARFDSVAAGR